MTIFFLRQVAENLAESMMNLVTSDARVKVTLHTVEEPDDDITDSEMSLPTVQVHAQSSTGSMTQGDTATGGARAPAMSYAGQLQKNLTGVEVKDEGKQIRLDKFHFKSVRHGNKQHKLV